MTNAELDELVRRNYTAANKSYLMEQQKIAEKGKQMSRYIDADSLKTTLKNWTSEYWTDALTGDDAWVEFMDMINREETLDLQPVIHAHWIKSHYDNVDGMIYKCSNCNYELFNAWNFCPHCGAKMDEEIEGKRKK